MRRILQERLGFRHATLVLMVALGALVMPVSAPADTFSVTVGDVTIRKDGHRTKISGVLPGVVVRRCMIVCDGQALTLHLLTDFGPIQYSASNLGLPTQGICADPACPGC